MYSFDLEPCVVPCPFLTVASCPAYRFLRRQVRWSSISHLLKNVLQFVLIHTVEGFDVVNEAEVDIFLELSCCFDDSVVVWDLNSGSSAFLNPAWTFGSLRFTYC